MRFVFKISLSLLEIGENCRFLDFFGQKFSFSSRTRKQISTFFFLFSKFEIWILYSSFSSRESCIMSKIWQIYLCKFSWTEIICVKKLTFCNSASRFHFLASRQCLVLVLLSVPKFSSKTPKMQNSQEFSGTGTNFFLYWYQFFLSVQNFTRTSSGTKFFLYPFQYFFQYQIFPVQVPILFWYQIFPAPVSVLVAPKQ